MPLPVRLTVIVALAIFAIEMAIMALFPFTALESRWGVMLLDSGVLITTLIPVLYAFILRPLASEIAAREAAESRLREVNAGLESRVAERTRELEAALEASESAARAKSQFLACVSHELRTPLNAVIGMTQLLLDTPLSAQQTEFARMSHTGGTALLTLINDILDFSKLEAGKLDLTSADFDLLLALEDCAHLVAAQAHEKGLEIAVSVAVDVPRALRGDDRRLRQILLNLLNNAVKFTSEGEVVLSARQMGRAESPVVIRFEVKDTGIGVPPDIQPRLFQAFTQGDSSTTRRYGGTGLGLAISRWIVELMGGRIGLESAPGKGSICWCEIPFERGGSAEAQTRAGAGLSALSILVVDDNAVSRGILQRRLDAWGMRCRCEADGPRAIAELKRAAAAGQPYGLVLIDARMPGMDGLELARAIRADGALSSARLIMMTSMGVAAPPQDALGAGAESCLIKPVRQAPLLDAIVNAVSKSAPIPFKAAAGAPPAPARRGRILLAEDNDINRVLAWHMLAKLGYEADIVANGSEAIRAAQSADYAVILMDVHMPEMDGFAATAAIRGLGGRFKAIPIIAVTADAMSGDHEKCVKAGMNDYLSKPFSIEALDKTLARWLR
ncbi:MAG: hypothetical protein A2V88_05275 [Elusimicrobia bacterium RBG_16_66_12]|nr:MAG: hypothetical protein A2V88_05275 [Elusimicrobia bacterium RBG_16_66_12]